MTHCPSRSTASSRLAGATRCALQAVILITIWGNGCRLGVVGSPWLPLRAARPFGWCREQQRTSAGAPTGLSSRVQKRKTESLGTVDVSNCPCIGCPNSWRLIEQLRSSFLEYMLTANLTASPGSKHRSDFHFATKPSRHTMPMPHTGCYAQQQQMEHTLEVVRLRSVPQVARTGWCCAVWSWQLNTQVVRAQRANALILKKRGSRIRL